MCGKSLIIFVLCLFLAILAVSSKSKWDAASLEVLSEAYSPYELCVLKLTPDAYVIANTVFDQPRCLHLIDSFHASLPKRCWLGGLHQPHDDGLCVGNKMKGDVNKDRKCLYLTDRKGLLKKWNNQDPQLMMNDTLSRLSSGAGDSICKVQFRKYPGYAAAVFKAATKKNFEIIAIAGDSMAGQMTQRLACAVLRANMTMHMYGDMFSLRPSGASALIDDNLLLKNFGTCETDSNIKKKMSTISSPTTRNIQNVSILGSDYVHEKKSIMLSTYKYFNGIGRSDFKQKKLNSIPDIELNCGIPGFNATCRKEIASAHIYKMAMNDFRGSKKWLNTLHFLLLPVVVKYDWEFLSLAIAINELAERIHPYGSRIVVLAPFSQHFPSNPGGLYINYTSINSNNNDNNKNNIDSNNSVCKKHTIQYNKLNTHIDSHNFQHAMDEANAKWRDTIGFFEETTEISSPWYDLHPESRSYGWPIDCTHYTFQPMMFEKIWHSLATYLEGDHSWMDKKEKKT